MSDEHGLKVAALKEDFDELTKTSRRQQSEFQSFKLIAMLWLTRNARALIVFLTALAGASYSARILAELSERTATSSIALFGLTVLAFSILALLPRNHL